MALLAEDLTPAEISERLGISLYTTRTHIQNAMVRLGYRRRASLAIWYIKNGEGNTPPEQRSE